MGPSELNYALQWFVGFDWMTAGSRIAHGLILNRRNEKGREGRKHEWEETAKRTLTFAANSDIDPE